MMILASMPMVFRLGSQSVVIDAGEEFSQFF